ncbi:MAG: isoprenylcysteine carboxylmethyltransferase family protein [Chthoniobacterales bacterium]
MKVPSSQLIGLGYLISELLLTVTHRSRGTGVPQDRSTLRVLWIVIFGSIVAGIFVTTHWRGAIFPHREVFALVGLATFVIGIALRWWAIITLGRFFTVDVQIAADHELVERGPFRLVRHPSYTGGLLAFTGFALSLGNWAAALVTVLPIFLAFVRRMNVEEHALSTALADKYASYMRRTKRLVPFVY